MRLPLSWKWVSGLTALLAVLLLTIHLLIGRTFPPALLAEVRETMQAEVLLASRLFAPLLAAAEGRADEINRLCRELACQTGLRLTVVAADGTVLGESSWPDPRPGNIGNHLYRPEVQEALQRGLGSAIRQSATVGQELVYVAAAVRDGSDPASPLLGFVRVARQMDPIRRTVRHLHQLALGASLLVAVVAAVSIFWRAHQQSRALLALSGFAKQVAPGSFSSLPTLQRNDELGQLSRSLQEMAEQVQSRQRALSGEKAELTTVLSSMAEGVLVVDASGRIRLVNASLREQFKLGDEALGKTVLETFRHVPLHELIETARSQGEQVTRELVFLNPDERFFDVAAATLRGSDGAATGTVVVFHDISRIKQLENMRKEFVANVSHELRTPLAIIKGYVETLLDEEPPDGATTKQFLQTIQKNARRLESLIEDLLTISAIESQQARLDLGPLSLRTAAEAVAEELAQQAAAKAIAIEVQIPPDAPPVRADELRLHQVFFNLLDNAIKYTQPNGRVWVTARAGEGEIEVCVADNGPGIAPEHLPRVFERFYRADKARSRELGGTGLGLSIVKHIVQAHGGRVWAESELEHGSRFYFTLPRAA